MKLEAAVVLTKLLSLKNKIKNDYEVPGAG